MVSCCGNVLLNWHIIAFFHCVYLVMGGSPDPCHNVGQDFTAHALSNAARLWTDPCALVYVVLVFYLVWGFSISFTKTLIYDHEELGLGLLLRHPVLKITV